jgi:hypothetical protein
MSGCTNSTTSAVVLRKAGGPEVLQLEQVPLRAPGLGELLLRQTAIDVNFHDCYVRSGLYKTLPLPARRSVGYREPAGRGLGVEFWHGTGIKAQTMIGSMLAGGDSEFDTALYEGGGFLRVGLCTAVLIAAATRSGGVVAGLLARPCWRPSAAAPPCCICTTGRWSCLPRPAWTGMAAPGRPARGYPPDRGAVIPAGRDTGPARRSPGAGRAAGPRPAVLAPTLLAGAAAWSPRSCWAPPPTFPPAHR